VKKAVRKAPAGKSPKIEAPAAPMVPVAPEAAEIEDMRRVPADIFELVMGIVSGEVQAFTVTPEMVGGRVAVKDGVMYLIEAGGVSTLATTASGTLKPAGTATGKPDVKIVAPEWREMQDSILKILKQYGEPMTARDLVTLLPEHLKSESDKSTWTRVGQRCVALMEDGAVTRDKNASNRWVYSAIAA
jgi:hypothetical protein